MDKAQIIKSLKNKHEAFMKTIEALDQGAFESSPEGKWSAGQHLEHIILSLKPLTQGLYLPMFILKLVFGKANRPSRSFDEVIAKYQASLDNGGKATGNFVPKAVPYEKKAAHLRNLNSLNNKFAKQLEQLDEKHFDTLVIPHPLIGKLTLREMLYFTIYHIEHHHKIIKESLNL